MNQGDLWAAKVNKLRRYDIHFVPSTTDNQMVKSLVGNFVSTNFQVSEIFIFAVNDSRTQICISAIPCVLDG